MSQLEGSDSQPGNWEELFYFLHRLGSERFQEQGWQEPYESRDSRTDLGGTGGETPPVYPTLAKMEGAKNADIDRPKGIFTDAEVLRLCMQ